jgi:hypothetical protein
MKKEENRVIASLDADLLLLPTLVLRQQLRQIKMSAPNETNSKMTKVHLLWLQTRGLRLPLKLTATIVPSMRVAIEVHLPLRTLVSPQRLKPIETIVAIVKEWTIAIVVHHL